MRITIEIEEGLLSEAMKITGMPTKNATIEHALKRLICSDLQHQAISDMRGMGWEGDLDQMRLD